MAKTKAKKTKKSAGKAKQAVPEQVSNFSPSQIKKFIEEVQAEFSKIVWPAKKVTLSLTGIVVLLAIVASLYLGSVDLLLGKLVSTVLQ